MPANLADAILIVTASHGRLRSGSFQAESPNELTFATGGARIATSEVDAGAASCTPPRFGAAFVYALVENRCQVHYWRAGIAQRGALLLVHPADCNGR